MELNAFGFNGLMVLNEEDHTPTEYRYKFGLAISR